MESQAPTSTPDDYVRSPVPDEATVGGFRIAIVIFGIGITLPIFFVGSQIAEALGYQRGLVAMVVGCVIVAVMMAITSIVGAKTRLSTYVILQFSFGVHGAKIVNALMAITLIGYFAATADIFGSAVRDTLIEFNGSSPPKYILTLLGCIVMSITALFGFRIVEKFSEFAVPILAIFMLYVVYVAVQGHGWTLLFRSVGNGTMTLGAAISAVVGANILMAVSSPDFARYAKDRVEALKSVTGLLLGFPVVMLASGIPAILTGETDIMKIMISLGVAGPAFVILVFATWTTNTVNLYSAGLTLATIFPKTPELKIGIVAAMIGTVVALTGFMDYFLPFVIFLGIATTPLAGVYLADFMFIRNKRYKIENLDAYRNIRIEAILAWATGSGVAYATHYGLLTLTTVSAIDALIVSFFTYLTLSRFVRHILDRPQSLVE